MDPVRAGAEGVGAPRPPHVTRCTERAAPPSARTATAPSVIGPPGGPGWGRGSAVGAARDLDEAGRFEALRPAPASGHADLGDEPGPSGEDVEVQGRLMRVGPQHRGRVAVDRVGERLLLHHRLTMEVDHHRAPPGCAEPRLVRGHLGLRHRPRQGERGAVGEDHHGGQADAGLQRQQALARHRAGDVERSQDSGVGEHLVHLGAVERVISCGDHIGAGRQEAFHVLGRHPHPRRAAVLGVDHRQVGVDVSPEPWEAAGQVCDCLGTDDVTYEQHVHPFTAPCMTIASRCLRNAM